MITVTIPIGSTHILPDSVPITRGVFGYNYTGFRSFDRFDSQLSDSLVGLISWPGGSLAENLPERYDLRYPDLWNGDVDFGLDQLFTKAKQYNAGVSLVLPTARYLGREDVMRADLHGFLGRVLDGSLGPIPERLILEIGNEYYSTFGTGVAHATDYGRLANDMVQTLSAVLSDPVQNPAGVDVEIAVQVGRAPAEDVAIRAELSAESLRNVDMLIYHRFAPYATGIDRSYGTLVDHVDDWQAAMEAAGGTRPEVFMSSYNVASYTRAEALRDYVEAEAALGITVDPDSIDMDGRTDTGFEKFWQNALTNRHYGIEQTRVLLELQAHIGSVGLGAASVYGVDLQHPARLSLTAQDGQGYDFVGQDALDLLAESTLGTRVLDTSIRNDQKHDTLWTYGFENDDKLVTFVTWHNMPPGALQVKVAGLSTGAYKAVWAETLHAEVPADWMTRFGIPDNPDVDETPESQSFALGVREHIPVTQLDDAVQVTMDRPHEILRLVFAKTDAGMAEIAGWEDQDPLLLQPPADDGTGLPPVDMGTPPAEEDPDTPDPSAMDDGGAGAELGGMLGALLLVAVLAMAL